MDVLSNLVQEFDRHFEDLRDNATVLELFAHPLSVGVDTVSEELQMELIKLQSDSQLHNKFRELSLLSSTDVFQQTGMQRSSNMQR